MWLYRNYCVDALRDQWRMHGEKSRWKRYKNATFCFEKNPGCNIPQNNSCTATYLLSHKQSKLDELNIRGTDGEVNTDPSKMCPNGIQQRDSLVLADQQRLTSALCGHWVQSRGPAMIDGLIERVVRVLLNYIYIYILGKRAWNKYNQHIFRLKNKSYI